jgi:hypothetical protein
LSKHIIPTTKPAVPSERNERAEPVINPKDKSPIKFKPNNKSTQKLRPISSLNLNWETPRSRRCEVSFSPDVESFHSENDWPPSKRRRLNYSLSNSEQSIVGSKKCRTPVRIKNNISQLKHDHSYSSCQQGETPRNLKRKYNVLQAKVTESKKKVKSRESVRKLKINVKNMSEVIKDLKEKEFLSQNALTLLDNYISGAPLELFKGAVYNKESRGNLCAQNILLNYVHLHSPCIFILLLHIITSETYLI